MSKQTDIRTKIEALLGTSKKQNLLVCTCQYGYCPKCYVDYLESLVRASVGLVESTLQILPYAEHGVPLPGHKGSCTPETNCDMYCSNAYYGGIAISNAQAALAAFRAEVEKAGKS